MKKIVAVCFVLMLAAVSAFAAAEARVAGHIIDAVTKKPVPNVTIVVSATERRTFNQTYKGDANGAYAFVLLDGTIKYKFTYSAPGYQPYEEIVKLKIGGEKNDKDVELIPGNAPAAGGGGKIAVDPSVAAFNDGAALYNAGKYDEAIPKFQEVVKAKPEMISAWEALAHAYAKKKDYPKAMEAAQKALDIAPDETDMYYVMYDGYKAAGDKAKADEWKKKLPADAATLFNDAVKLLNAGKDAEAEPLLRQSIAANDKFPQAHYELGMVLVRKGKMADAKAELQKYLELDPNGKDAAIAKESLKYLQ